MDQFIPQSWRCCGYFQVGIGHNFHLYFLIEVGLERTEPLKEMRLRLISWISHCWCCGYFSTLVSVGNEGGGPGRSAIVLDELPATHREYWYLDLPDPQSAECGKCEVSMDLNMHKMSEKCSSWKTVPFFFSPFLSFLRLHHCANVTSFPSFCFVFSPNVCFPFFTSFQ